MRIARILLCLGVLTLPLWVAAQQEGHQAIGGPQVRALVEALRLAAPNTGRADDGLYSDWKIRPDNISRWSRRCLGVEFSTADFESNPITAREILECRMGQELRDQYAAGGDEETAVLRTAAWWMTGDPEAYQGDAADYSRRVLDFYRNERGAGPARQ